MRRGLAKLGELWTLSGARPGVTADRPSYTVRIAPKDDGGLLGAAEMAWDAVRGVPLRAAVYAQGTQDPVLELEATEIDYGPIAASKVDATPPAGAKVTELNPPTGVDAQGRPTHVTGLEAVQKRLDFPLAAPETLAGLPRRSVSLVKFGDEEGALLRLRRGPRPDRRLPAPRGAGRQAARRRRPGRDHAAAGQHRRRHRAPSSRPRSARS